MTEIRERALVRADRLRAIMQMPEYDSTLGAWLSDLRQQALQEMTSATDPHEIHRAQGAYNVLNQIQEQIDAVFAQETAALERHQKRIVKKQKE